MDHPTSHDGWPRERLPSLSTPEDPLEAYNLYSAVLLAVDEPATLAQASKAPIEPHKPAQKVSFASIPCSPTPTAPIVRSPTPYAPERQDQLPDVSNPHHRAGWPLSSGLRRVPMRPLNPSSSSDAYRAYEARKDPVAALGLGGPPWPDDPVNRPLGPIPSQRRHKRNNAVSFVRPTENPLKGAPETTEAVADSIRENLAFFAEKESESKDTSPPTTPAPIGPTAPSPSRSPTIPENHFRAYWDYNRLCVSPNDFHIALQRREQAWHEQWGTPAPGQDYENIPTSELWFSACEQGRYLEENSHANNNLTVANERFEMSRRRTEHWLEEARRAEEERKSDEGVMSDAKQEGEKVEAERYVPKTFSDDDDDDDIDDEPKAEHPFITAYKALLQKRKEEREAELAMEKDQDQDQEQGQGKTAPATKNTSVTKSDLTSLPKEKEQEKGKEDAPATDNASARKRGAMGSKETMGGKQEEPQKAQRKKGVKISVCAGGGEAGRAGDKMAWATKPDLKTQAGVKTKDVRAKKAVAKTEAAAQMEDVPLEFLEEQWVEVDADAVEWEVVQKISHRGSME